MKNNWKIFVLSVCFVAAFLFGYIFGRPSKTELRVQYERGVHLTALYKNEFGCYPSMWFRDVAFEFGDPQDKADLDSIDTTVDCEIEHGKRYHLSEQIRNDELTRIAVKRAIKKTLKAFKK